MQHDHILGGCLRAKYLLPQNICYHVAAFVFPFYFDMQHDHILKKLIFDPTPECKRSHHLKATHDILRTHSARTYVVFLGPVGFFEESKPLLYFVLGMYGEDENGCWQPWIRGRHQL